MTPNKTTQPPNITRERLDHLKKIVFSDALKLALEDEDYRLAHQMKTELDKLK